MSTRTLESQQAYIRGTRPMVTPGGASAIPADWLIFNAPRPIPGSCIERPGGLHLAVMLAWSDGEWHHGDFYSAVNPNDEQTVQDCLDLDAWSINYVTDEEILLWAQNWEKERGLDLTLEQLREEFDAAWKVYHEYRNAHLWKGR